MHSRTNIRIDMCLQEIGIRVPNVLAILGSVVNINAGGGVWTYMTTQEHERFTLTMTRIFI